MLTTFRRRLNRDFDTMITRLSTDFSRGRHIRGSLKVGWNGGWMAVIKSLCAFLRLIFATSLSKGHSLDPFSSYRDFVVKDEKR